MKKQDTNTLRFSLFPMPIDMIFNNENSYNERKFIHSQRLCRNRRTGFLCVFLPSWPIMPTRLLRNTQNKKNVRSNHHRRRTDRPELRH